MLNQKALQNHHGLGVDRPAKLSLTLQVNDSLLTDPHCAGNSVRQTKFKIPVACHGQAVDLPDGLTAR